MIPRIFAGIAVLIAAISARAETRWIHVRSANFEMYSSASEGAARDTIRYFEQVRGFFLQTTQHASSNPLPVYIVAFGSEKEYAPYRLNAFADAYYHPGAERDYIVMGHAGAESFPVATHEYAHLVVQHAGLKFPPWLDEGLAELYSTLRPLGDKIIVGSLIPGRVQALRNEKWVPLSAILVASHSSPYYNEKNKAGSLYNEGWGLVHMLALSAEYRPKFTPLLTAIHDGTPSIEALEKTYGKPLGAIEKDLQTYLHGDRFNGVALPAKLEKEKAALPIEPAAAFDVSFALADLINMQSRQDEARQRFEELSRDDPQRPEPWSALAYLAWRNNNYQQATDDFSKAFALGARGPRLLWDFGRLGQRDRPEEATRALAELVALQPARNDARVELASAQLAAKHAADALQTLSAIKKVDAAEAARVFGLFAYAQIDLGMPEEARASVDRLQRYAKTPEDKDRAQRLSDYLDNAAKRPAAPPRELLTSEGRPRLERRELTAENRPAQPDPSVSGAFVELKCLGAQAQVAVETPEGLKKFVIEDPGKIRVSRPEGGAVTTELQCGPQNRARIRIEYAPAGIKGVDGAVRALYFEP